MITQRLMNLAFRQPMPLSFMFSTKKKQMELTIKTPYRTIVLTQKPLPTLSQDSAESSPKLNNPLLLSKIELHPHFTSSLQATWNLSSTVKPRELLTSTCIPADGSLSIRNFLANQAITPAKSTWWTAPKRKMSGPIKSIRSISRTPITSLESMSAKPEKWSAKLSPKEPSNDIPFIQYTNPPSANNKRRATSFLSYNSTCASFLKYEYKQKANPN